MQRPMNKDLGRYLAISISPKGEYLRTYHDTESKAQARLRGNRRHHGHRILDTQPPKAANA